MNYKAICFDFDYTLADCTDSIIVGFNYGFQQLGHPIPDPEDVRRSVGFMLEDSYTMITGDTSEENRKKFRPLFIEAAEDLQKKNTVLLPGGEPLLHTLYEMGIQTGIVSSKRGNIIDAILQRLELRDMLSLIIGSEHVASHKPDPEGILQAVERLAVDKSEVLYCGDTILDAQAARDAGVDFVAVLNGTTPADAFTPFPHVAICEDLWEVGEFLGVKLEK